MSTSSSLTAALAWLDPWRFADKFEAPAERDRFVADFLLELINQLRRRGSDAHVSREIPEANARITATLDAPRPAADGLPVRGFLQDGPGLTGHAPEGMFQQLVTKRVLQKARRRQNASGGG
jgi:hypothetical protein